MKKFREVRYHIISNNSILNLKNATDEKFNEEIVLKEDGNN
jgi:hypothetical protein